MSTLDRDWLEIVNALLRLDAIAANGKPLRDNVLEALSQLSRESTINKLRLARVLEGPPALEA